MGKAQTEEDYLGISFIAGNAPPTGMHRLGDFSESLIGSPKKSQQSSLPIRSVACERVRECAKAVPKGRHGTTNDNAGSFSTSA